MSDTLLDLNATIARYATFAFDDATPLLDVGLESLSLLRLAVEVATDEDAEIDATRLVDLRTVADLKVWLTGMIPAVDLPTAAVPAADGGVR